MVDYTKRHFYTTKAEGYYDQGLREYMVAVFRYMAMALGITGIVAMGAASSPSFMQLMFGTPLSWVIMLAPIGMAIYMSARIHSMSTEGAQISLGIFSAVMGLSLSSIFLVYTGESIARVFFITASVFGAMSLYGYTTKKDLTSMGSFMFMGFIGILIASLVNIFLASSMLHFVISILGVVIFTGLTAYDTQRIKESYYMMGGSQGVAERASIFGALTLYMDFINLFVMLLNLFGTRRD